MTEFSLHILDIVQNSVVAKATFIGIKIMESITSDVFSIEISDNGKGMDAETLGQVTDPFFTTRTTRKVGLGLSLFKQASEQCGGSFNIMSVPGTGTTVKVSMPYTHIDRQPLGDMAGMISLVVSANPEINFMYSHKTDTREYIFDTREIKNELEDVPITNLQVVKFIRDMIRENLDEIRNNL
jgi:hypothetical protein